MTLLNELNAKFGTDAALGVTFCALDANFYEDDGGKFSIDEYAAMSAALGPAMPECVSHLPDGSSATCCTSYAIHVYKALPGRVQIFGFENEKNPTSRVAREELHPYGHDFAVVDGRYLVDPWVKLVLGVETAPVVFDMQQVAGAAEVLDVYGPQSCWERMVSVEQQNQPKGIYASH